MFHYLILDVALLLYSCQSHPVLPKPVLSSLFDVLNAFHSLHCLHVQVSVVLLRFIATLFKLMNCVFSQLFVMEFSMGLGPCKFAGVVLGLKMTVALGPAETK